MTGHTWFALPQGRCFVSLAIQPVSFFVPLNQTCPAFCSTSTCRRHDINLQRYLTQLLSNLPTTPMSQLDQWLPDRWKLKQVTHVA